MPQFSSSWFAAEDDALAERRAREAERSSGWVLVFGAGLMLALTSLAWLLRGHFFESTLVAISGFKWDELAAVLPLTERLSSFAMRIAGAAGLCAGALAMAMALTSFRRGQRWAWYAAWALPLLALLDLLVIAAYEAMSGATIAWYGTFLALAVLGLVIAYPAMFTSSRAS